MAQELRAAGISRSAIHDAFSGPRLPQWHAVDALLEILASRAPSLTAEQQLEPLHALWLRAAEAEQSALASSIPVEEGQAKGWALLLDVERFASHSDAVQMQIRQVVHDFTDAVLASSGVGKAHRHRVDRGDSLLELIDGNFPLVPVLRSLLLQGPIQLHETNRMMPTSMLVRLRIVVATAPFEVDSVTALGWRSQELNDAIRLLDSYSFRQAMHERTDVMVLAVTDPLYREVVEPLPAGVLPAVFDEIIVDGKSGPMVAWRTAPMAAGVYGWAEEQSS
ncbi:hypothetical protein ACIQU3_18920 [Streptomyces sp. NPDC101110]|uniref:hypothetical protein n=1 Tax=Streptomyces sp. NPDC101110 TaxID=3366104 RepID=UPI00380FC09D